MDELANKRETIVTESSRRPPDFSLLKKALNVFVNFITEFSFFTTIRFVKKIEVPNLQNCTLFSFVKAINRIFFVNLRDQK